MCLRHYKELHLSRFILLSSQNSIHKMKTYVVISAVFLIAVHKTESASVQVRSPPTSKKISLAVEKYEPPPAHPAFIYITTTAPNEDLARKFAKELVERKLAGLVNIFQPGLSVYVWEGRLSEVQDVLLHIYTRESLFENVEQYIRANHPDVEPGALAIPIVNGSDSFLEWLANGTQTQ